MERMTWKSFLENLSFLMKNGWRARNLNGVIRLGRNGHKCRLCPLTALVKHFWAVDLRLGEWRKAGSILDLRPDLFSVVSAADLPPFDPWYKRSKRRQKVKRMRRDMLRALKLKETKKEKEAA